MADFEVGDEVDVRFDKSIVTGVERYGAHGLTLTVQTADVEIRFDYWAADVSVRRTGVVHQEYRDRATSIDAPNRCATCPGTCRSWLDCTGQPVRGDTGLYPHRCPGCGNHFRTAEAAASCDDDHRAHAARLQSRATETNSSGGAS